MIAKNRICCNYTKENYYFVKNAKFNYCPECGKYLNDFQLEEDFVEYRGKVYEIAGEIRNSFGRFMLLQDSHGDIDKKIHPKYLKRSF